MNRLEELSGCKNPASHKELLADIKLHVFIDGKVPNHNISYRIISGAYKM